MYYFQYCFTIYFGSYQYFNLFTVKRKSDHCVILLLVFGYYKIIKLLAILVQLRNTRHIIYSYCKFKKRVKMQKSENPLKSFIKIVGSKHHY